MNQEHYHTPIWNGYRNYYTTRGICLASIMKEKGQRETVLEIAKHLDDPSLK